MEYKLVYLPISTIAKLKLEKKKKKKPISKILFDLVEKDLKNEDRT